MDVEPRNAETMAFPGRSLDQHPISGRCSRRAMADGKPVASDPIRCCARMGRSASCWLHRCCRKAATAPAGFVTFSYELAPLMLTNDDLSLFSVVLKDPRNADSELIAERPGHRHVAGGIAASVRRRR